MASARSSISRSPGGTVHLLGQPDEGPVRRFARRVWRRLAQRVLITGAGPLDQMEG